MVSPADRRYAALQRRSASDTNFRCSKGKWFRLRHSWLQRFRISWGQFGNRCRESPRFGPGAAVILDFRLRIENHCKIFPGNVPKSAVILDFMGSIWESLQGLSPAQENGPPATVVAVTAICRLRFYLRLTQRNWSPGHLG